MTPNLQILLRPLLILMLLLAAVSFLYGILTLPLALRQPVLAFCAMNTKLLQCNVSSSHLAMSKTQTYLFVRVFPSCVGAAPEDLTTGAGELRGEMTSLPCGECTNQHICDISQAPNHLGATEGSTTSLVLIVPADTFEGTADSRVASRSCASCRLLILLLDGN